MKETRERRVNPSAEKAEGAGSCGIVEAVADMARQVGVLINVGNAKRKAQSYE